MVEASCSSAPSLSTRTRGPSMPRMMGRLAPAPKWLLVMPGSLLSVSPSVASRRRTSSSPSSTVTGVVMSPAPSCRPLAETVTEGRLASAAAAARRPGPGPARSPQCSNQSNGQGHGAQGKAAGCQCGMNHEEPWKSKNQTRTGQRPQCARAACNSPRGHRPACPATMKTKSTLALANQAPAAIKSGVMSALPTSPWHSTGLAGAKNAQGPPGPSPGSKSGGGQRSDSGPQGSRRCAGLEQGPVQHPPVLHQAHRGVVGAGGDRQARRRGQQTIGQGQLIQQQTVQPAGVGGQQGFDQRGCGWCRLRTGMGCAASPAWPVCASPGWAPRGGRQNAAPGAPGPGWAPMPGPAAGRPARPPAMRAHRHAARGGARTLVGPWQRQAHGR